MKTYEQLTQTEQAITCHLGQFKLEVENQIGDWKEIVKMVNSTKSTYIAENEDGDYVLNHKSGFELVKVKNFGTAQENAIIALELSIRKLANY